MNRNNISRVSRVPPASSGGEFRPGGVCRVIIGGSGGQGVVTAGKLLAGAAMAEGFEVTCYPVYGAEMRGGYAFASVVLSRELVCSPIITRAEAGLFLSPFAFSYLGKMVPRGGVALVNSDLVNLDGPGGARHLVGVPFVTMAREAGDERCANMVAVGYLARLMGPVSGRGTFPALSSLRRAVPLVFPDRRKIWDLNRRALLLGYEQAARRS